MLDLQRIQKKVLNRLRLDAISIPDNVIKKRATMVLDTARPRYKENTTWLGMRGRDAVRKSTPKVNILQVFTIEFSEIQIVVNHNSQSDGQNKCKEWDELAKEDPLRKKKTGREPPPRKFLEQNRNEVRDEVLEPTTSMKFNPHMKQMDVQQNSAMKFGVRR